MVLTEDLVPHGVVRDHLDDVERDPGIDQRRPLLGHGKRASSIRIDQNGRNALCDQVGRAAPPDVVGGESTGPVGMDVDEAGSNGLTCRVDRPTRNGARELSDGHDLAIADAHVGAEPGVSGTVDDMTSDEEDVERTRVLSHHGQRPRRDGHERKSEHPS